VKDVIELRELRVDAIVGVLDRERRRAQPLAFDIDLQRSFAQAAKNEAYRLKMEAPPSPPTVGCPPESRFSNLGFSCVP